jgi:hypothetical protein
MLTPQAGGLPTRFADFPMHTIAILLRPTADVSLAKWQVAKSRSTKYRFKLFDPGYD